MKNRIRSLLMILVVAPTVFAFGPMRLAQDPILIIHATDAEDQPVNGVVFFIKGNDTHSDPTNRGGNTQLALPKATHPNDWVHLQVTKGTGGGDDWILISPWDGRVAVPPFDDKPDHFVLLVVAKKFDRHLLANAKALAAMTASVLNELAPKTAGEKTSDERRQTALADVAKEYGLPADKVDEAIRAWGEKSKDPYEVGLAALYAKNYPLASEQLQMSLEMREAEVANTAFFLGQSLYEQGKYQAAANAYRKAAAQRPDNTTIMNNLAVSLTYAGNYAEAEPLLKRALAIDEMALGPDHPNVAIYLNSLATLYREQGKYAAAEPLYKRAIAIDEKALRPDHPTLAVHLNNLAMLYDDQGNYAEAEPLLKQALAIDEKALGPDHPKVAIRLNNLAELYKEQRKYAEAEPLYKQAQAIIEKTLGPSHPYVAASLNNLALLYQKQGKYAEAEPLYKQAIAMDEKALGPDHPGLAIDLNNLAGLYRDQGKYAEAEPLYKRALTIFEKVLGPDHPNLAIVMENYAFLLRKLNRETEAAEWEARAKAIRAKHQEKNPKN